jgi:hypothetical protein
LPNVGELQSRAYAKIQSVGLRGIGWAEKEQSENFYAPCFRFGRLFGSGAEEECDEPVKGEEVTNILMFYIEISDKYEF